MNPFKWFTDLIERSALWYAMYIIGFRLICGKLFKSMTDNQYYVFSILFLSFFRSVYKELHADHETGAADNK